jgi:acyl-CoA reductase-like NAD-dependent aldehyde dehydrogenase
MPRSTATSRQKATSRTKSKGRAASGAKGSTTPPKGDARAGRDAAAEPAPIVTDRLEVTKTYKLFINGAFPRSESGRAFALRAGGGGGADVPIAHVSLASRKDLRDAVEAARAALPKWSAATAYNRGQVLYRLAEMMQGKAAELRDALAACGAVGVEGKAGAKGSSKGGRGKGSGGASAGTAGLLTPTVEVELAIDAVVHFAGWADKLAQVLGSHNPVAGPYYNFTIPEPVGVAALVPGARPALLPLITLLAPALAAGATTVVLASPANPIPACVLAEACATSDIPAGVVNILTGQHAELLPHVATHRDIDAVAACGLGAAENAMLRGGAAENLKRVTIHGDPAADGRRPWTDPMASRGLAWLEPMLEYKTIWHPAAV